MKRNQVIEIIAALFILLFVYTAVSKLQGLPVFQSVLARSPLIGKFNVLVSWAIPVTELAIAILLFVPASRRTGLYAAMILMGIFTMYLGYMLVFTPDLPCSCGGVLKQLSWQQHLLFNLFFLSLAVTGLWLGRQRSTTMARITYSAME